MRWARPAAARASASSTPLKSHVRTVLLSVSYKYCVELHMSRQVRVFPREISLPHASMPDFWNHFVDISVLLRNGMQPAGLCLLACPMDEHHLQQQVQGTIYDSAHDNQLG